MSPAPTVQASPAGSSAARTGERNVSPLAFALDQLFPKRGGAPYATAERLVVLIVVRAMSCDGGSGEFNCFLSYPTIARWSGISVSSVKRMMQKHCDGPAPLLQRSLTGETRGHRHACYRFTLVRHPEKFAAARDAARAERLRDVDRALRDLQPDRLALQRQREDFGGTLTEAEYRLRLTTLERAIRRQMPPRAFLKPRSRPTPANT